MRHRYTHLLLTGFALQKPHLAPETLAQKLMTFSVPLLEVRAISLQGYLAEMVRAPGMGKLAGMLNYKQ